MDVRAIQRQQLDADTDVMSARFGLTIGLTIAAVAFGGWRMLLPGTGAPSDGKDPEEKR